MDTRAATEELVESISSLREAAKDLVLSAARLWRVGRRSRWRARLLSSAVDALDGADEMLGHAFEHSPHREVGERPARCARLPGRGAHPGTELPG